LVHRLPGYMATSNNILTLRRHDLDNLKTYLTSLVIFHHTSNAYSPLGLWGFRSTLFRGENPALVWFNGYNQTFFMGLFFWISGRVSAQALQRARDKAAAGAAARAKDDSPAVGTRQAKTAGTAAFLRNKVKRLGVPTLVYSLAIWPLAGIITAPKWDAHGVAAVLRDSWRSFDGTRGPVWYTATLLAFDAAAAAATYLVDATGAELPRPREVHDALTRYGWLLAAAASFLLRTRWPVAGDDRVPVIGGRVGFLSQYVVAYALGWAAFYLGEERMRSPWEAPAASPGSRQTDGGEATASPPPPPRGPLSVKAATAVSLALNLMCFAPLALAFNPRTLTADLRAYLGGWDYRAALYALWNEASFVVVGPAMMALWRARWDRPARSRLFAARYAYAAFLVHTPVSIAVEVALDAVLCPGGRRAAWMETGLWQGFGAVVVTAVVGAVNTVASFAVARGLVDYVPGVGGFV
jgi:glucans biosynthesis protein C